MGCDHLRKEYHQKLSIKILKGEFNPRRHNWDTVSQHLYGLENGWEPSAISPLLCRLRLNETTKNYQYTIELGHHAGCPGVWII